VPCSVFFSVFCLQQTPQHRQHGRRPALAARAACVCKHGCGEPAVPATACDGASGRGQHRRDRVELRPAADRRNKLASRPEAEGRRGKDCEQQKATLELLQRNMAAFYIKTDWKNLTDDWSAVNSAYEIYCAIFRTYLLDHYGACTSDLRFYTLAAVAPDSLIVQQGSSHWKASRLSNDVKCNACGKDHFGSYSDMIRAYALDLATLSG
jgi:hypothetical protein